MKGRMGKIWEFAKQTRVWHMVIIVIVMLLVAGIVAFTYNGESTPWWNWLEPFTGTTTLFVAIAVWGGELAQDWENSLPKRLDVRFVHKNSKGTEKDVMLCEGAYLASEADIRAWGQQLGGQMDQKERFLQFEPNILQKKPEIKDNEYKLFDVTFVLTKLPKGYCQRYRKKYGYECAPRGCTVNSYFDQDETLGVHWHRNKDNDFDKDLVEGWDLPESQPQLSKLELSVEMISQKIINLEEKLCQNPKNT